MRTKDEHDYYFVEDKLKLWFLNDRDRARLENEQGNRVEVGCPVLLPTTKAECGSRTTLCGWINGTLR